ncbi:uncharacterized protein LOC135171446 [Diachasmimorpha longicaudata]|uniref:uncharacterized protein LOC135171446 n=1 Tax=Diachasmimorpha longicaudata TaxID=58733 RepID=UPI0030B8A45B
MKSLELIVTCVVILHILKPSDGIFHPGKQLLNVISNLKYLQRNDHPCGSPEVLIPMLKGKDPVKPSQLGMMMVYMNRLNITDPPGLDSIFDSLKNLMDQGMTPSDVAAYNAWKSRLEVYVSTINALYDRFTTLRKDEAPINVDDWMALATDIEETMPSNLTAFRAELLNRRNQPGDPPLLTDLVHSSARVMTSRCTDAFAMNGFFNLLSNLVFMTQLKATVPQIFSSLLRNCNGTVRKDNLNRLATQHRDGYLEIVRGLKDALIFLPDSLVPCYSSNEGPIRGQDYYELEISEQLTVQQFPDPEGHKSCSAAQQAQSLTIQSPRDVCNGTLYDCEYSEWLEACRLENSTKRYEWIKSAHGNYGEILEECPGGSIFYYRRERNPLIGHCVCKCQETVNHISVTPAMTDQSAHMVLTGFRFVLENGVLYLQVKQGKMLPGEKIDAASEEWVPLPKDPKLVPLNSQNSNFHIGDVMTDMSDAPVGISFVKNNNGFYLQMHAVSYEYYHGVFPAYPRDVRPAQRNQPETYVKFQLSNRGDKTVGQVLPLLNAKAAEADPPVLLGGLGIAYDSTLGGMISPRIKGFDFSDIFKRIEDDRLYR